MNMKLGVRMFRGVHSIHSVNTFSGVVDEISLEGRNLIITGGNGCGKTRFITKLFDSIFHRVAQRNYRTDSELNNEINTAKQQIANSSIGSQNWSYYNEQLPILMDQYSG